MPHHQPRWYGTPYNRAVRVLPSLRTVGALMVLVYLCSAGWFFILVPWSAFWTSNVVPASPWRLMGLLSSPAFRGALSGFGVLHFAVAAGWLTREGKSR